MVSTASWWGWRSRLSLHPVRCSGSYVALGAAVSVVTMSATASALKALGVPTLTFPFVLVTWLLLLATYGFAGLGGDALPAEDVIAPYESFDPTQLGVGDFLQAALLSISQVFLKASIVAALLFLAGLAVNSVAAAVAAIGGAFLAVVTAHLLGAESDLITGGLLGFSPVLTAVALGTVFHPPGGASQPMQRSARSSPSLRRRRSTWR